ncbi:MAG: hypothetical protein KDK27_02490 [Leptospiraceae bacterium]|nr:hypothetical protein [Leptospiraceae bacterium]
MKSMKSYIVMIIVIIFASHARCENNASPYAKNEENALGSVPAESSDVRYESGQIDGIYYFRIPYELSGIFEESFGTEMCAKVHGNEIIFRDPFNGLQKQFELKKVSDNSYVMGDTGVELFFRYNRLLGKHLIVINDRDRSSWDASQRTKRSYTFADCLQNIVDGNKSPEVENPSNAIERYHTQE